MIVGQKIYAPKFNIIEKIDETAPVRWNGIDECYEVCNQGNATHTAIVYQDDNNDKCVILVKNGCEDVYLLIDAI